MLTNTGKSTTLIGSTFYISTAKFLQTNARTSKQLTEFNPMEHLLTFTHPTTWANIFTSIIEKLGPEFYKWDGGIGFGNDNTEIIISHRDRVQKTAFLLQNIEVSQPAVAGGWFTSLAKAKKQVPNISLRGYTEGCNLRFRHDQADKEGELIFGKGANIALVGDQVYISPHGWMTTDLVEILEILP